VILKKGVDKSKTPPRANELFSSQMKLRKVEEKVQQILGPVEK
jgi:hypothetical protein